MENEPWISSAPLLPLCHPCRCGAKSPSIIRCVFSAFCVDMSPGSSLVPSSPVAHAGVASPGMGSHREVTLQHYAVLYYTGEVCVGAGSGAVCPEEGSSWACASHVGTLLGNGKRTSVECMWWSWGRETVQIRLRGVGWSLNGRAFMGCKRQCWNGAGMGGRHGPLSLT